MRKVWEQALNTYGEQHAGAKPPIPGSAICAHGLTLAVINSPKREQLSLRPWTTSVQSVYLEVQGISFVFLVDYTGLSLGGL